MWGHTLTNHNSPCDELWYKIVHKCMALTFLFFDSHYVMFLWSQIIIYLFFIVYGTPQSQRLLVCPKKLKNTPSAAHRKAQPNLALGSLGQARLFQSQHSTPILSSLLKKKKSSILSFSTKLGKNKNNSQQFSNFFTTYWDNIL